MLHFSSKRFLFWVVLSLIHSQNILSQDAVVKGRIIDAKDSEPLIGVNIQTQDHLGTVTNINGEYQLNLKPGNYNVIFKYIGYNKITKKISVQENQITNINLKLFEDVNQLEEMVISASKYEQKLGDVSVSMTIIKPELIENKATRDAESIIQQVPGVQINENQASIRGGSGWSYGAGSRVLVMVDGMPMLAVMPTI